MSKMYLVLDLETTGLSPENDYILEIAWRFLDEGFQSCYPHRSFVVDHQSRWGNVWSQLRSAPEAVKHMHADSGLIATMVTGDISELTTLGDIARALDTDLERAHADNGPGTTIHLMGLSCHFDAEMLKAVALDRREYFPFGQLFDDQDGIHHRMVDLSSVKLMLDAAGVPWAAVRSEKAHRALDDVNEAVEQAQMFRTQLQLMFRHELQLMHGVSSPMIKEGF